MSWPALELNEKMFDASTYQNLKRLDPDENVRATGRIDFVELANENPEVKVVISRASGSWSGIDPDFEHNYDESEFAGFDPAAYVNINPTKSVDFLMTEWWGPAIGDRNPRLIVLDCETNGWRDRNGKWHNRRTPAQVTRHVQDGLKAIRSQWSEAIVWIYSAAWWWDPNIVHGWESDEKFWVAHYIYVVQDPITGDWRVAYKFVEIDRRLPIDNNFTPYLPQGVAYDNAVAWQVSDKGIIQPVTQTPRLAPRVDLGYVKVAEHRKVWHPGEIPPDPEPVLFPVDIEIRHKTGQAAFTIVET